MGDNLCLQLLKAQLQITLMWMRAKKHNNKLSWLNHEFLVTSKDKTPP